MSNHDWRETRSAFGGEKKRKRSSKAWRRSAVISGRGWILEAKITPSTWRQAKRKGLQEKRKEKKRGV